MTDAFIRGMRLRRGDVPDWSRYPFDLAAIRSLDALDLSARITFLCGENGSGKSTLLEAVAIACGLNPEGGSRNMRFSSRDTHSELHRYVTCIRGVRRERDAYFLRAESMYNVASRIDESESEMPGLLESYGGVSLHARSHGESFLALIQSRFRAGGLYILDEPEAPLSPMRQLTLLCELDRLCREGCQLIIATHSPILMSMPGARIYLLDERGITETPYEQTEHFTVSRAFFADPGRMLRLLLERERE
ncbi:MAG: AAA family ATPase [Candidatus Fimadaptatus sp.]